MRQGSKQWSGEMPGEDGSRGDGGSFPAVQWLSLHTSNAGGESQIPRGRTKTPQAETLWFEMNKNKNQDSAG